jgi:hypothetical protein
MACMAPVSTYPKSFREMIEQRQTRHHTEDLSLAILILEQPDREAQLRLTPAKRLEAATNLVK